MSKRSVGTLEPGRNVLNYKWKVDNFSNYNLVGQCLYSPSFSSTYSNNVAQWRLHLYPNGTQWPYKDYLSIFLEYLGDVNVTAYVNISILDAEQNSACFVRTMEQEQFKKESVPCGDHKFVSRSFVTHGGNHLLKDGTIIILCKIVLPDASLLSSKPSVNTVNVEQFDRFEHLLETGKFSDVTFSIGDKRLRLHKVILASCSPVFRTMFEHNMKENQSNVVDISDVSYEVMREIVRFMYTNKVNGIDTLAVDLLLAADMYSITELKDLCEKALSRLLGIDNALQLLTLAITCNAVHLKATAIEFIIRHLEDFLDRPQFKSLDSDIANQLFAAIAKKKIIC